jgi:hypothetical protein
VLKDFFIIQSGLATYLRLAAIALAMKNFVSWYRAWEYLRDLLDARNAAPILAKLVENDATEEELSTIHLASFPKDVPEAIRAQAAASIARAYSPETLPRAAGSSSPSASPTWKSGTAIWAPWNGSTAPT